MKTFFKLTIILLGFFVFTSSFAKTESLKEASQHTKKNQIVVKVKGMVCAFCAQGIEKNFSEKKEVKSVNVDLDKMEVVVMFNKGHSLPEKEVQSIVTSAGFAYVGIK